MPELRWTRDSTFQDGQRNFRARGPGVYDIPEDAVEEYLDHRSDGWERVDDSEEAEAADTEQEGGDESEADEAESGIAEEEPSADDFDGESETLPFNPENKTNSDIREEIQDIDDEATLVALLNLEKEQKDRKGAKDHIKDRIDKLEE